LQWHEEFDKKLGAPTGLAVQGSGMKNMSWTRSFASGTKLVLDVAHKSAKITWAQ